MIVPVAAIKIVSRRFTRVNSSLNCIAISVFMPTTCFSSSSTPIVARIAVNAKEPTAYDVVIYTIYILLAFDRNGDVQVLEQVLFAVLKDAPNVIH
jgi:hypothetical protein